MNERSIMRTWVLVVLLIVTVASVAHAGPVNCAVTPSNPACAPSLKVTYHASGGGPTTVVKGGTSVFSNGVWTVSFVPESGANLFTGGVAVSSLDPFVGFSFGVVNSMASNETFTFDYTTPFFGGPYTLARTIGADVLIDAAFTGTASVIPVGGGVFIINSYVDGVLIPSFGRVSGCTTGASFVCTSGASGALGPKPYASTATGSLEITGSFILTPGSQYTLTGRTDLLTLPEPGSVMLLASGVILLGLGGALRRKLRV